MPFPGHPEVFVNREIERAEMRRNHGASADISERPRRWAREGSRIQPTRRRLHGCVAVPDSGIVRPVRTLVAGACIVDAADTECLRHAALQRVLPAGLPAANDGIQYGVAQVQRLTFADGKIVAARQDEAMASVECG